MIALTDLYAATNALLQTKYPDFGYYGHEVREGYSKPSFFVDIIPKEISNDTKNYKHKSFTIMITYFSEQEDEIDNLTKADEIIELFGYTLDVNDRKVAVTDANYEFAGEKDDTLQVSIEIEFYETIDRPDTNPIASGIILK